MCSRLEPHKIYDFASYAKDLEKKEHSSRLQMLREARRNKVWGVWRVEGSVGAGGVGRLAPVWRVGRAQQAADAEGDAQEQGVGRDSVGAGSVGRLT